LGVEGSGGLLFTFEGEGGASKSTLFSDTVGEKKKGTNSTTQTRHFEK